MVSLSSSTFTLPPTAREWLAQVLCCAPASLVMKKLNGSTSSTLFQVSFPESERPFVLRCHTDAGWLADEPDLIAHETAALAVLSHSDLPVPRLIAADPGGQYCSVPALLMTSLPGQVVLKPPDFAAWLRQIALPLERIHALPAPDFAWKYRPYVNPPDAQIPPWTNDPDLWQQVIEIARQPFPAFTPVFIHRDYHPVNILFADDRLSGIVDWPNACLGPAAFDIAWCRQNLTWMFGPQAADQFLDICREVSRIGFTYHPFWDILAGIEALPGPLQTYPPWLQFGLPSISTRELTLRHEALLRSALQQVDS